jgi:hypothetical protein
VLDVSVVLLVPVEVVRVVVEAVLEVSVVVVLVSVMLL